MMLSQKKKHVICFGEVLMDNLLQGRRIGGAPLNVCYHLNKNGLFATIVSQVGNDALGGELIAGIAAHGIDTTFVAMTMVLPSSSVEVTIDQNGIIDYDIVHPVAWDALAYSQRAADLTADAGAFVHGSLVARDPTSRRTLYRYLEKSTWPVFDINLRPPYVDSAVTLNLISKCKTLKVNADELSIIRGWLVDNELADSDAMELLLDRFPNIEEILLTRGSQGAVYRDRSQEISKPAKKIIVKDTVGSGDAFLAGFLARRFQGASAEEALVHAINLSALVAAAHGACPDYPPSLG